MIYIAYFVLYAAIVIPIANIAREWYEPFWLGVLRVHIAFAIIAIFLWSVNYIVGYNGG